MTNTRKILIVDDDAELREALVEQLAQLEEFESIAVDNGTKGVQAAKAGQIDLVIMARTVVDDERLTEPLREPLTYQARRDVRTASGREANNDAHRPRWIGLRPSSTRHGQERGSARGEMEKISTGKFHFEPPFRFTSLDHLVGERHDLVRDRKPERFGGLEVDHQLEFGRPHDR
jgi:hypothetical protein